MTAQVEEIKNKIKPLLKEEGVLKSSLFGSVVRGDYTENSDIDILVELPKGRSLFDLVDLKEKLERLLGRDVDVLTFNSVHPLLRDIIFKQQVSIF